MLVVDLADRLRVRHYACELVLECTNSVDSNPEGKKKIKTNFELKNLFSNTVRLNFQINTL